MKRRLCFILFFILLIFDFACRNEQQIENKRDFGKFFILKVLYLRRYHHRLLLLKLDKQISGTIYQPILAANKACHMEGVGCPIGGVGCHVGGGGYSKHAFTCLVGCDFHH